MDPHALESLLEGKGTANFGTLQYIFNSILQYSCTKRGFEALEFKKEGRQMKQFLV